MGEMVMIFCSFIYLFFKQNLIETELAQHNAVMLTEQIRVLKHEQLYSCTQSAWMCLLLLKTCFKGLFLSAVEVNTGTGYYKNKDVR